MRRTVDHRACTGTRRRRPALRRELHRASGRLEVRGRGGTAPSREGFRSARCPHAPKRSTTNDQFHRADDELRPLWLRLRKRIGAALYVAGDETSIVQQGLDQKAYVWTFVTDTPTFCADATSRSGDTPRQTLGSSSGSLLCDAYTGSARSDALARSAWRTGRCSTPGTTSARRGRVIAGPREGGRASSREALLSRGAPSIATSPVTAALRSEASRRLTRPGSGVCRPKATYPCPRRQRLSQNR